MSYASTAALQVAIYDTLSNDATVAGLSAGRIYDALPSGTVPDLYVSLGPERVKDRSDQTGTAAIHEFPIKIVSSSVGFQGAKTLAAAVSDALVGADLVLSRGSLIELSFLRSVARRTGSGREIEVWFRALIDTTAP